MRSLSQSVTAGFARRRPPNVETGQDRNRNPHLRLEIDLDVIRYNVEAIARAVEVPLLPVVKADAYGLGIETICDTLSDLAAGFCVFQAQEAITTKLAHRTGKRVLALGPPESTDPDDYIPHRITPAVCNPLQARQLRKAHPALCIDTGMQRFACPPEQFHDALVSGACSEAFTHATGIDHVKKLKDVTRNYRLTRHAAASSLLDDKEAVLDAVRPGLAMYHNAISISVPIAELRESRGPVGYSGFTAERHGTILAGYAHGLRKGPCLINGRRSRVLEVGMQSAFVEAGPEDRVGDDVVLLGKNLSESDLAASWNCSPHEALISLSSMATRRYLY